MRATPLRPGQLAPEEGGLFGHIEVFSMGEEVTPKCHVRFNDERGAAKAVTRLDDNGWVFLAVKAGPTYLASVTCALKGGTGEYTARGLGFEVQKGDRLAYFGHVSIDMLAHPERSVMAKVLFGAIGAAIASAAEGEGGQATVNFYFAPARNEYKSRFGSDASALEPFVSLAGDPRPVAEQNRPERIQSDDVPASFLGFGVQKGISEAGADCTVAGLEWKHLDDGRFSCSRTPLDLGVPASTFLSACGKLGLKIELDASTDGAAWSTLTQRFVKLSKILVDHHGAPHQRDTKMFDDCKEDVSACFTKGRVRTTSTWQWRDAWKLQIVLDGDGPGGKPSLTIVGDARETPGTLAECR